MSSSASPPTSDVILSFGGKILRHESALEHSAQTISHLTNELEGLKRAYQLDVGKMRDVRGTMADLEHKLQECQRERDYYLTLHTQSIQHRRTQDQTAEDSVNKMLSLEDKAKEADLRREQSEQRVVALEHEHSTLMQRHISVQKELDDVYTTLSSKHDDLTHLSDSSDSLQHSLLLMTKAAKTKQAQVVALLKEKEKLVKIVKEMKVKEGMRNNVVRNNGGNDDGDENLSSRRSSSRQQQQQQQQQHTRDDQPSSDITTIKPGAIMTLADIEADNDLMKGVDVRPQSALSSSRRSTATTGTKAGTGSTQATARKRLSLSQGRATAATAISNKKDATATPKSSAAQTTTKWASASVPAQRRSGTSITGGLSARQQKQQQQLMSASTMTTASRKGDEEAKESEDEEKYLSSSTLSAAVTDSTEALLAESDLVGNDAGDSNQSSRSSSRAATSTSTKQPHPHSLISRLKRHILLLQDKCISLQKELSLSRTENLDLNVRFKGAHEQRLNVERRLKEAERECEVWKERYEEMAAHGHLHQQHQQHPHHSHLHSHHQQQHSHHPSHEQRIYDETSEPQSAQLLRQQQYERQLQQQRRRSSSRSASRTGETRSRSSLGLRDSLNAAETTAPRWNR